MTYRTLPLIAVTLVATMLPAHAAQTLNIDVIAEQGNRALEQIRAEAAQALPGRVRAQIALPPRAEPVGLFDASDVRLLQVQIEAGSPPSAEASAAI